VPPRRESSTESMAEHQHQHHHRGESSSFGNGL
jgi:hypothetical protein